MNLHASDSQRRIQIKLPRKAVDSPDRGLELEEHMDINITELLAKAADAGYT